MTKKQIKQDVLVMVEEHILPNYTEEQQEKILTTLDLNIVCDMYKKSNSWLAGFTHESIINEIVDEYISKVMGTDYIETEYYAF